MQQGILDFKITEITMSLWFQLPVIILGAPNNFKF